MRRSSTVPIVLVLLVAALLGGGAAVIGRAVEGLDPGAAVGSWAREAGAEVRTTGPVDLVWLPTPRLVARDVRIDVPGVIATRAAVAALVADPVPLLLGRFVPATLRLADAAIVVDPAGVAAGAPGRRSALRRIELVDARVVVAGGLPDLPVSGTVDLASDGGVSADLLTGRDAAVSAVLSLAPGGAATARVRRGGDALSFDGTLRPSAAGPTLEGRAALAAPTLAASVTALGADGDRLPLRAMEVTADLRIGPDGLAITGLAGQSDLGDVGGALAWGWGAAPAGLRGRLDIGRIQAERLVPVVAALWASTVPADLRLRAAGLVWSDLDVGIADITLRRTARSLSVELADAALLDGSVAAWFDVQSEVVGVAVSGGVRVNAIDAERLSTALGGGPAAAGDLRGEMVATLPWSTDAVLDVATVLARLEGQGNLALTGGRIGAGMFGLTGPLPVDGLSGAFTLRQGVLSFASIGLAAPPQRFFGRGTVRAGAGGPPSLDLVFAPADPGTEGSLPAGGFRLQGPLGSARPVGATVALDGPRPAIPGRPMRASPRAPPMALPSGVGRGG